MHDDIKMLMDMADANDPRLPEVYADVLARAKREGRPLDDFKSFNDHLIASVDKHLDSVKRNVEEYKIKEKMGDLADAINFAYIARKYFGKSRSWLYQRIKGNLVNGKPAKFSPQEEEKFYAALNDIRTQLGAVMLKA